MKILLLLKEFPGVLRHSQEELTPLGPCIVVHLIQSYTEHVMHRMLLVVFRSINVFICLSKMQQPWAETEVWTVPI